MKTSGWWRKYSPKAEVPHLGAPTIKKSGSFFMSYGLLCFEAFKDLCKGIFGNALAEHMPRN
jgi:hypothetical protein